MKLTLCDFYFPVFANVLSKIQNLDEVPRNKDLLLEKMDQILSRVTSPPMMDKIPPGIRYIFEINFVLLYAA